MTRGEGGEALPQPNGFGGGGALRGQEKGGLTAETGLAASTQEQGKKKIPTGVWTSIKLCWGKCTTPPSQANSREGGPLTRGGEAPVLSEAADKRKFSEFAAPEPGASGLIREVIPAPPKIMKGKN